MSPCSDELKCQRVDKHATHGRVCIVAPRARHATQFNKVVITRGVPRSECLHFLFRLASPPRTAAVRVCERIAVRRVEKRWQNFKPHTVGEPDYYHLPIPRDGATAVRLLN